MEIACRSSGIIAAEFPQQGVRDVVGAGFNEMMLDLSAYYLKQDLEEFGRGHVKRKTVDILQEASLFGERAQTAIKPCQSIGLQVSAMYAPFLPRNTHRTDLNELLEKLVQESILLCNKYGARYLVVRPVFAGIESDQIWHTNRNFYLRLAKTAKEYSVTILLENQAKDIHGHLVRGLCSDEWEAARWVDDLNASCGEERFGFCLDTGVASICGKNMYEFVKVMGKRLKMAVLQDIDGMGESSLLPFTGVRHGQSKTDWTNLIRGMREISFSGKLVLSFEDTVLAFSSFLRPHLLLLAKAIGGYIGWQLEREDILAKYEQRVLFGAGNTCQAYMKYYGDKYPPLFTCDNNSRLWGAVRYGLEIHPPKDLLFLPEECVVVICSIYYREIEKQLRDMGIKNPIEYFNDECLPSFHFELAEDEAGKKRVGTDGMA